MSQDDDVGFLYKTMSKLRNLFVKIFNVINKNK